MVYAAQYVSAVLSPKGAMDIYIYIYIYVYIYIYIYESVSNRKNFKRWPVSILKNFPIL